MLVEAPFGHFGTGASTHGMTFMIPGSSLFGAAGEPVFVRGDANLDGLINISDAITILGALFLGTGPLGCEDSADTNDDGVLNVTDAISPGVPFPGRPCPAAALPHSWA